VLELPHRHHPDGVKQARIIVSRETSREVTSMDARTRQAKVELLREISEEVGRITGTAPYMYANCPNTDDGSGAEYFRFQGDVSKTGVDAALEYMRQLARQTPGATLR
jgi:hypothetical protein